MPTEMPTRRTLVPLALLLSGLLGAGPFVPRTLGAEEAGGRVFEVPGLAALLGVALAAAALAGIAIARRRLPARTSPTDRGDPDGGGPSTKPVDPLVAALRGPAAYAPDDLDARLTSTGSGGQSMSAGDSPVWVRRIHDRRPDHPHDTHEPDARAELRAMDVVRRS
jgi:hypothetical protein